MKANYILEGTVKRIIAMMVLMLAALVTCWAEVVIVPPFQDRDSGLTANDVLNATDSLINAIYQTKRFEVPDRDEQAQKLQLGEIKFQMSDWSDERKTVEMGKVLNADFIVRGVVSKNSDGTIYLFVRLLDGKTAKMLGAAERTRQNFREIREQMGGIVKELLGDIQTLTEAKREAARRYAEIAQWEAEWAAQEQREAERAAQAQAEAERVAQQMRDAWKNKRIYFGLRGGGNFGFYDVNWQDAYTTYSEGKGKVGINFAFSFLVQTNDYFAFQTELLYMHEEFEVKEQYFSRDTYFSTDSFMVPILLKGTFRPSIFSIGASAGIYFNIPLSVNYQSPSETAYGIGLYHPSLLGAMIGADFGIKAGIGIVKLDMRYAFDFGKTEFMGKDFGTRSMLLFTIGYDIGLKDRK
ncbi:hypothetical protein AGMMS49579_26000 [Spirochaetia bacterium]|nr:hypothetical protein AGMMS49579_26000 [Spirochaetia bacterium]